MGWLRELMEVASPPIDGYGELARRALMHPEWPSDTQPAARSLAALFSKLDRGIELMWLADRGAVQRTLALVLGCPIEWVRRAVAQESEENGATRLRLDDLPYARPLDLRDEPLPPGLPGELLQPSAWRRLWWLAPSGSGRTLVGRWLAARGLARFGRDGEPASGGAGPLYVELERALDAEPLERLPESGVCVAAPFPPPPEAGPGWSCVVAPPLLASLPALLAWVEARVPEDGAFEVAAAEAWLAPVVAAGALPTLGAVLGAAGVLDARGVREVAGKTLAELAEAFVNERLEAASTKGSGEAQWLKRYGFGALVKLAESTLTSQDEAWGVARSLDEWMALVPAELARSVDSDWVRWSLARAGGPASLRVVERALRDVPPGAYRLVRALVDAHLLGERTPGRWAVVPAFVAHAALTRAQESLLAEAPAVWGEALLRPHAAPALLTALYRRCAAEDFAAVERVAELELLAQPALVVASEAALLCLGLRALSGAEVPLDCLEQLWNEQLGALVELPGALPRPRLLCVAEAASPPGAPLGGVWARHAVWLLALLAAGELLRERQGRAHPLLRPWSAAIDIERLRPVLDRIYTELALPELAAQAWAVEGFALLGRLLADDDDFDLHADGAEPDGLGRAPVHATSRPAQLARALARGGLDAAWLEGFGQHPLELPALDAACVLQHVPWSRWAHAAWKAWQARGCPASCDALFAPDGEHRARFWPHLPPEVLAAAWPRWVASDARWPFELFGPSQWSAFVDGFVRRWREAPHSRLWRQAFELLPQPELTRALGEAGLLDATDLQATRPLLGVAWRRFPGWLGAELRRCADAGEAQVFAGLLGAVPHDAEAEVLQLLAEELSRRSTQRAVIDAARVWLFEKISARRSDWRSAYVLFAELEARLARAERVRGVFDTRAAGQER